MIQKPGQAEQTVSGLYQDLERRIAVAPSGNCPVELTGAFLRLCLAQSCGKCVPCRVGLNKMSEIIDKILDGKGTEDDLDTLEYSARSISDTADCAIGHEAAEIISNGFAAFKDDYLSHIQQHRCISSFAAVPCVTNCPAHVDIPGYIALVKDEKYADAVRLIREDNPFPSVCGLICEHPCEEHCRRNIVDASVNIRGLKRAAIENAGTVPAPKCLPPTGKKVCVIGGGPTGLTCAYYLALMGHSVTVYERRKKFGGMLRYGIPRYRLPAEYLDADIDVILSTGIEAHTDTEVGKDVLYEDIMENFDGVYIAIGCHSYKMPGIPGEDAEGVISAVDLLRHMGDEEPMDLKGKRVCVIGGGNVAMDASRTALRLGAASVQCVYRRRQKDMTALAAEIAGAAAEGVELVTLAAPVRVNTDETGRVTGLVVKPQIPGDYSRGRPAPKDADAPEAELPCDVVVVAIGQAIDMGAFANAGIPAKAGKFQTERSGEVTGQNGVYAGGDCASGPATVIMAIQAGKIAAANLDEYFGYRTDVSQEIGIPQAGFKFKDACGRCNMRDRPPLERVHDFDLIENSMTLEEVAQECTRCLRCDHYGYGAFRGGRERW